jgi:hypothetical protein
VTACERAGILAHGTALTSLPSWSPAAQQHFDGVARLLVCSYRDTFRLLLRFAHKKLHTTPDQLSIEQIDAPMVTAFLNDLENSRGVSVSTSAVRVQNFSN